jgi:hypothetical protein
MTFVQSVPPITGSAVYLTVKAAAAERTLLRYLDRRVDSFSPAYQASHLAFFAELYTLRPGLCPHWLNILTHPVCVARVAALLAVVPVEKQIR